jgi:hypothetical protein
MAPNQAAMITIDRIVNAAKEFSTSVEAALGGLSDDLRKALL